MKLETVVYNLTNCKILSMIINDEVKFEIHDNEIFKVEFGELYRISPLDFYIFLLNDYEDTVFSHCCYERFAEFIHKRK
jgi:hypothetical protein